MNQFTDAFAKAGMTSADNEFRIAIALYINHGGTIERAYALLDEAAHEMGKSGHLLGVQQDQGSFATLPRPMPEGHPNPAQQGYVHCANGQPTPSEGQNWRAKGHFHVADARPPTLNEDHLAGAQQGPKSNVPPEPPMPEGQTVDSQRGQTLIANGLPIRSEGQDRDVLTDQLTTAIATAPNASGEATSRMPNTAKVDLPPAREPNEAFRRALVRDRMQNATIWLDLNKTSDGRFWSKVCPYEFDGMERDARTVHHIKFVFGEFNQKQRNTPLGKLLTPDLQKKLAHRVDLMEGRRA